MHRCLAIVACLVTAIGAEGPRAQSPTPLGTIVTTHHEGMYDGSCAAMDEAVQRAEPHLRSHVTNRCYVGGHMMYSDLGARREMQRDFAVFVREALAASASRSAR